MANWKISQLPLTAGINETDLFEKVDGLTGVSERNTMTQVATALGIDISPTNSVAFTVSLYSLTANNAQSLMDLSGTWNTTGTPTAIKLAITDTASNAASLLMDLRVGAASQWNVTKAGAVIQLGTLSLPVGTQLIPSINFGTAGTGISSVGGATQITFSGVGAFAGCIDSSGPFWGIQRAYSLGWLLANSSVPDLQIFRDAANILALRNLTNAQVYRIYGTFTDAANYERLIFSESSMGLIDTEAAGTGTRRGLTILTAGGTLAFFGNTPVVKQTQGATLTNNVTAGGAANTLANYTDLTIYANDAAAIRNNIYQLGQTLKTIVDGLRLYGLFT